MRNLFVIYPTIEYKSHNGIILRLLKIIVLKNKNIIAISLGKKIQDLVDRRRGLISRSAFIESILKQYLGVRK